MRPLVVVCLLAVALVLIGRTTGSGWTMVIVSGLVGVIAVAAMWPALSLRRVQLSMTAPRDGVAGRPLDLGVELSGAPTSVVIDVVVAYRGRVSAVPASGPAAADVPGPAGLVCSPPTRGVVERVDLKVRCAAPLGLIWWRKNFAIRLGRPIDVAPVPIESPVPPISQGEGGDRHRPERRSGHDSVRTVRDYVAGDATRLVHWGLTARRDQLTVKELEDPEGASLAIVADLRGDATVAEKTAGRAAGMCIAGLRGGLEVVLCTAEPGGPRAERVASPLSVGRRLARAVAGPPAEPPRSSSVVRLP